jgi:hypothetical protein
MAKQERIDIAAYRREMGLPPLGGGAESKPKGKKTGSKLGNKKLVVDHIKFDSILEAAYYMYLVHLQSVGIVSHFFMQVPFQTGAGIKYRLDFLVFYTDGQIDYVDTKGFETDKFKDKKKRVEARYPLKLNMVKAKDFPASFRLTAKELHEQQQREVTT